MYHGCRVVSSTLGTTLLDKTCYRLPVPNHPASVLHNGHREVIPLLAQHGETVLVVVLPVAVQQKSPATSWGRRACELSIQITCPTAHLRRSGCNHQSWRRTCGAPGGRTGTSTPCTSPFPAAYCSATCSSSCCSWSWSSLQEPPWAPHGDRHTDPRINKYTSGIVQVKGFLEQMWGKAIMEQTCRRLPG